MEQKERKEIISRKWFLVIIAIWILLLVGGGYLFSRWYKPKIEPITITLENKENKDAVEKWVKNPTVLLKNTTSTCTLKLDDGTYRMYFMAEGGIHYADSADGQTFSPKIATGVKESSGKMLSNPAVIKINNGKWIMIYEEQAINRMTFTEERGPGPGSQRNLMLASSADGKKFTKVGIAIDSSKEDNYFASVPDLIKLPDGRFRMYYVSGGEAIGSAISENGGSWKREPGYRLEDRAVDPNVKYENGKWVMYFSTLPKPEMKERNAIFKATSKDGLTWEKDGKKLIEPDTADGFVVDPDVVKTKDGYRMFFGESKGGVNAQGSPIDLYFADWKTQ